MSRSFLLSIPLLLICAILLQSFYFRLVAAKHIKESDINSQSNRPKIRKENEESELESGI